MFELILIAGFILALGVTIGYERWLYKETQREFNDTGWRPKNSTGDATSVEVNQNTVARRRKKS